MPAADPPRPGALAARRHDLLAALALHGLAAGASGQRLALRLILLLTARYNWQTDRLAIGRDEIARLWQVDPRTVRREMARLRKLGWLEIRRAAARGRVAVYGLGLPRLLADLGPVWPRLGPDFAARGAALETSLARDPGSLHPTGRTGVAEVASVPDPDPNPGACGGPGAAAERPEASAGRAASAGRVAWAGPVPICVSGPEAPLRAAYLWQDIRGHLARQDPAAARVWLDPLEPALLPDPSGPGNAGAEHAAQLVLTAPSAFVARYVETHFRDRILAAARQIIWAGAADAQARDLASSPSPSPGLSPGPSPSPAPALASETAARG